MKKKFTFLIAALMLLTMISQPTRSWGQIRGTSQKTEGFQAATTNTTYNGTVNLTANSSDCGLTWTIYYGNISGTGAITGSKSCLMRSPKDNTSYKGYAKTTTAIKGLTNISFDAKVTNTGMKMGVWYSMDGTDWIVLANDVTFSNTSVANKSYNIPNSSATTTYYIKIGVSTATSAKNDLIIDNIQFTYTTYTVTYNAGGGSGTMTDSNSPYSVGAEVTLLSNSYTAPANSTFNGWVVTDASSNQITVNNNKFTMPASNVTVTAQWESSGDYITVTPTTADVATSAQNIVFNVVTDQSLTASSVQFYTAASGGTTASKPDWIGTIAYDGSSSPKTLTVPVTENTGAARHAYFTLKNGSVESSRITINQAAITVLPPTFNHGTGTYYEDQSITLTNQTAGASIYYTIGANPADPTSSSTQYTEAISVTATTKIKAIAIKNGVSSEITTAEYTIVHPITIAEAREQATGSVTTRGIVTYISGKNAYIQDASEAALCLYKSSSNWNTTTELTVGDDVVASGTLSTYTNGGDLLEISNPTRTKLSSGNAKPCVTKTVAQINSDGFDDFQGLFVQIVEATYNGSSANTVTQNGQTVSVNGTMGEATANDVVTFKGNITYNSGIIIKNLQDVSIIADPTISAASSLEVPNYVQGTPVANITAGSLSVSGSHLTEGITCTLDENSKFELYNGSSWTNTTTIAQTSGSASGSLQIRLKAGQSYNASAYTGSVTLSSTSATSVVVNLSGSVTYVHVTYNGNADGVTNVPTDATNYTYNQQVTVLGEGSMTRTGYDFVKWNTESDGTGQDYVENGTFNITEDVTLYAQWAAKSYSITADPAITNGSISFTVGGAAATTAQTGQTVTIVSTPATGYGLSSVSVNSGAVTVTNNTFVMPAGDVTVSATFVVMVTDALTPTSIGVYSSAYTAWTDKTWSSDAVYDGKTSGGDNYASKIQLRVKDKNEGIITTATGGKIKKVVVTWNSSSSSGNTLNVYGMNSSYSAVTDLYNQNLYGSLIGQIVCGTSTELIITNDTVTSIGLRSDDGTIYLDEIDIIWDPIKYTVTYDANGGSGSMSDPNSPYTSNSTVTVLSNSFTGPVVSEVTQEFARWNTKADGSGTNYNPGATFSMPKENVTLYAQWIAPCTEKATMDDVVLNAAYVPGENRIKLEMLSDVAVLGGCDITDYGFVYSTSVANPTIGADNCTKIVVGNEYTSAGDDIEYTMDNATLGATYYVRSYAINNAGTAYSAVESVMIASSYPTYTITYSTNGNSDGSSTINQGNAIGTLPTPTESYIPDGYEFVGWYNGDSYSNATAPTVVKATDVPDNNMNLKAMFAISPSGGEQYLEITIGNFSEITTSYTTTFTHEYPEATITAYGVYKNSNGIQMNSGKGTYIKNTTAMPGAITKFELTWTSTGNNSPTMYANTNSVASTSSTSLGKQSNSVTTQTINTTVSDGYRYFYFDGTTVTGACYLSSFKIYYLDLYYTTSATVPSGDYWHVNGSGVLTDNTTIPAGSYTFTSPITVPNGKTLTVNGYLGTSSANLIIEEGGQLIIPNDATVAATFRKEMPEAPADKDRVTVTGWKLISSPTTTPGQAYESFESVTYLTASGYLLYNYDEENRIWRSSQTTGHTYSTLNVGQGYLYGNSTGTAIEFTGNVNSAASYSIDLSYNEKDSDNLAGFNLIGNPFSHEIAWSNGVTLTGESISNGYYKIDGEGFSATLCTENIAPLQGILVKANATDQSVTFNNVMPLAKGEQANHDNIMFKVENSECSDVAYALFDKGYGLNKISHRGDMVPMLYIPQNGENYAIAMMDDNTKTFNLGFEAKTTAKYTLTYKAKGEFNYLHVIDRMTGEDIDMLLEGEYSFVGSPQDDNNRFIVRLGYLPNYDDNGEDTFAYQNGSDIVVSGEGELQIFDVMGRKVASITINGVETVNIPTQGVYIMKLNEKTQKIVVR